MRVRILCLFDTQRALQRHTDTMLYVPSAKWDARNQKLALGDTHVHYRVVSDMEDVLKIAGYAVHLVEWHYKPKDDVRLWVMSKVRGVL